VAVVCGGSAACAGSFCGLGRPGAADAARAATAPGPAAGPLPEAPLARVLRVFEGSFWGRWRPEWIRVLVGVVQCGELWTLAALRF
jgi:hypothetical protein